ncbi:MAG TPA: hypothetical protein VFC44_03440 [Candidatus Saccharimonadales bacterium]|nr:hypothetical protein [Candidatus Saccharimonadales bacterium]
MPGARSNIWKAGAASVTITPEEPMWLAGWASRCEPADGVALDLRAKALALQDEGGRYAVILTADLIAIPRGLAEAVADRIHECWGLPRECLIFNASHTHNGPEVRPDKVPFFEIPPSFAAKIPSCARMMEEKMAGVANAALENLAPVGLRVSQASVGFATNRRVPPGIALDDIPVLEVSRPDGQPLAILFGYACHNLVLPPAFRRYHGDYAGIAQQNLEETFPGAVALFLSGAGGDLDPAPRGSEDWALAHGHALADAVKQSMSSPRRWVSGGLRVAFEDVPLDFAPPASRQKLEADAQSRDAPVARKARFLLDISGKLAGSYLCPVQGLFLGRELLLFALGGEPVADYATRLQKEFAGPVVWVAGYCNDMFGYLPSRRVQEEGGYEAGRALLWSGLPGPFAADTEARVIAATRRLAARLRGAEQNDKLAS